MVIPNLKETLFNAGIHHTEFAKLLQVNRITVQKWTTGCPIRSKMTQSVVAAVLARIELAVIAGKLPVRSDLTHHERLPAIRRALK